MILEISKFAESLGLAISFWHRSHQEGMLTEDVYYKPAFKEELLMGFEGAGKHYFYMDAIEDRVHHLSFPHGRAHPIRFKKLSIPEGWRGPSTLFQVAEFLYAEIQKHREKGMSIEIAPRIDFKHTVGIKRQPPPTGPSNLSHSHALDTAMPFGSAMVAKWADRAALRVRGFEMVRASGNAPEPGTDPERFKKYCSRSGNKKKERSFWVLASFRLRHRPPRACSADKASPEPKNPRSERPHYFLKRSRAMRGIRPPALFELHARNSLTSPTALFKSCTLRYARFINTASSQDSVAKPGETRVRGVRWKVASAIASLIAGTLLAHVIEPGVGMEKLILAGNTPTIHLFPKTSGPHPVALLAHGVTASKETMFRFGEALAAAGFDCYAVDLAGHGESRLRFSGDEMMAQMRDILRALGRVDVFVGHSMGAGVGEASVQNGDFSPRLFIAAGGKSEAGSAGAAPASFGGQF